MSGFAWVTLATNDSYSLGALVLAHSLKKTNTPHKLVVLITPSVSPAMKNQLQTVFDIVKLVEVLDSKDEVHLALLNRPELGITFTKLHCWKLTEFEKCVFLDADTLVVRNCDDLFEREELSAAPDFGWPDCFNSGVFVYKPSEETFNKILQFAIEKGSYDGGDQGLLNQFFSDWSRDINKHLPFLYNLATVAAYSYYPAFKQFGSETRIVHFLGTGKPWLQKLNPATRTIAPVPGAPSLTPLFQKWWDIFCEKVHPTLDKNLEAFNGMPQPPTVEASSNCVPVEINCESQKPSLNEPSTQYREFDDFRQSNLPYRPFDVKSSSGTLLNVEFFTVSAPPPPAEEEDSRKPDIETETKKESENELENKNLEVKEEEPKKVAEEREEEPQAPKNPFDHDSFFPDEKCVSDYLKQNTMVYQPFEEVPSRPNNVEEKVAESNHEHGPEENVLSLPRFLSIPEDDKRQSGNSAGEIKDEIQAVVETSEHSCKIHEEPPPKTEAPVLENKSEPAIPEAPDKKVEVPEKKEIKKSKSAPLLDVTKIGTVMKPSICKSQTELNLNSVRKFSMPKLKPILPKKNSFQKEVQVTSSKITLYTEFVLSSDYREPANLPKDNVGFVELHMAKAARPKKKHEGQQKQRFGPLPVVAEAEKPKPAPKKTPRPATDLDELYDLKHCKRQLGNKPKPKETSKKEETKQRPKPRKVKSVLSKKWKVKTNEIRESVPEKKATSVREPKKSCVLESKPVAPRKEVSRSRNDVEEILKRLKDFSKDYLHFFGEASRRVKWAPVEPNPWFMPATIYEKMPKGIQHPDRRNIGA